MAQRGQKDRDGMLAVALPRTSNCPAVARRSVREAMHGMAPPSAVEDVMLVASELVTNALIHGEGQIELRLRFPEATRAVVEVVDEGSGAALEVRDRDPEADGGWGLQVVDTLALRWGAFEGTTHVWAELALD